MDHREHFNPLLPDTMNYPAIAFQDLADRWAVVLLDNMSQPWRSSK
jgi:hypothetical protein